MIWEGQQRSTVFVLGAGATRGAFDHATINRKRLKAPLNGDFFRVVEAFVRAQGERGSFRARYDRLRDVFREEFPTRGRWPISMEEAFSCLYVSKDFPEIYGGHRGRLRQPGTRQEIEDFLRLTFGILTSIEAAAPVDNLYSRLATCLGPNDTLVTLNYDTLLDSALLDAGWDPATGYGLIGGANKITWRMVKPPKSTRLERVKLLKLHGSLNWYVRGSYGEIQRVFDAKPRKVIVTKVPRTNEMVGFIRQIVPPIYGKFFGHTHWRTLWASAFEALVTAEVLVVIGCSLVDTDFHLSGMLSHAVAVRKRGSNPLDTAVVVNHVKVRRKWLRVLRGCVKKKIQYRRFSEFAKECLIS